MSLFGGHREGGETFLQCAVREIPEEISYFVPAERFEYLAGLSGGDIDAEGGSVHAEFFIVRDIPIEGLIITEGSLLVTQPDEIIKIEHKLTPVARFVMGCPDFKRRMICRILPINPSAEIDATGLWQHPCRPSRRP